MDEDDDLSGAAALHTIAHALDLPYDDALRALGGGWRPVGLSMGEESSSCWPPADWFVSGEPMQVLLGISGPSLTLARMVLRWDGPGTATVHATEQRQFAREDVIFQPDLVAGTVADLAVRSRRTFRWCRTCRTLNRPEHMQDRAECMGCAADYRGVRY